MVAPGRGLIGAMISKDARACIEGRSETARTASPATRRRVAAARSPAGSSMGGRKPHRCAVRPRAKERHRFQTRFEGGFQENRKYVILLSAVKAGRGPSRAALGESMMAESGHRALDDIIDHLIRSYRVCATPCDFAWPQHAPGSRAAGAMWGLNRTCRRIARFPQPVPMPRKPGRKPAPGCGFALSAARFPCRSCARVNPSCAISGLHCASME